MRSRLLSSGKPLGAAPGTGHLRRRGYESSVSRRDGLRFPGPNSLRELLNGDVRLEAGGGVNPAITTTASNWFREGQLIWKCNSGKGPLPRTTPFRSTTRINVAGGRRIVISGGERHAPGRFHAFQNLNSSVPAEIDGIVTVKGPVTFSRRLCGLDDQRNHYAQPGRLRRWVCCRSEGPSSSLQNALMVEGDGNVQLVSAAPSPSTFSRVNAAAPFHIAGGGVVNGRHLDGS